MNVDEAMEEIKEYLDSAHDDGVIEFRINDKGNSITIIDVDGE